MPDAAPSGGQAELTLEDADTARLVARAQAGDREAFGAVYLRYFDRVYSYMHVVFGDSHEAEDATQHVFLKALEALPRYRRGSQPFRAWLFVVVRNHAVTELRHRGRITVLEPAEIERELDEAGEGEADPATLDWLADGDLVRFIERLPLAQRQVLVLRYMLDLRYLQIARMLGRTHDDVRRLHHRAVTFLRERLAPHRGEPDPAPGGADADPAPDAPPLALIP